MEAKFKETVGSQALTSDSSSQAGHCVVSGAITSRNPFMLDLWESWGRCPDSLFHSIWETEGPVQGRPYCQLEVLNLLVFLYSAYARN